jgi:hypothetical protein
MHRSLAFAALLAPLVSFGQTSEESPIKFALYSPSWGSVANANLLAGLRLVVDNQTSEAIHLESIEFIADVEGSESEQIVIDLEIPAASLAERELAYIDLLSINQCVNDTLEETWRLVEISNYTLNPSVRRLIIQDTTAFRIYQCVSSVRTSWSSTERGEQYSKEEWVLYHFESKPE